MSIYRKHGGQRGYNGNVLNLPEDTQGFLNSLPPNVGGLPILVIRSKVQVSVSKIILHTGYCTL